MIDAMPLTAQRNLWTAGVCSAVLTPLGDEGEELLASVRGDLGPELVVAALFAARAACLVADARDVEEVVEELFRSRVVRPESSSEEFLLEVAEGMEAAVAHTGLKGAEPWDPDSTLMLLLEIWAPFVTDAWSLDEFRSILALRWGVTDPKAADYLTGLPLLPLEGTAP
jgi:hypothetical protein